MPSSEPQDDLTDEERVRALTEAIRASRQRKWVRIRELGWVLIGFWQFLSLASEFVPIVNVESRPVRIIGKFLGLAGLIMVAYGFERLTRIASTRVERRTT